MAFELIKVSELPELTAPSDPNVIPIQDGNYLKRISFENLKEAATGGVADDLAAEVTARESAVSDEATARGNADAAILADLASAYNASATYAVGDYCTKDGQLYRCTTAISTAEAWTSGHWSAVALGDETSDLRSALNALESGEMPPYPLESGTFLDNDGKTKSAKNDRVRTVDPIDLDEISTIYAADGYEMWCYILDANKSYINTYSQSWAGTIDKSVILNRYSNAKYINVVFRDAVTSSKDLRELVSVIQNGTVYTSQKAENTNAAIDKINEFVNAENIAISVTSNNYYLATNGAAASSTSFEIHKYQVAPNDILYLNIEKREGDEISVFQFQNYDNVPSGTNPYIVGSPYTDAYKGFITVPDGATWLLVSYHRWYRAETVQKCSLPIDGQLNDISALQAITWSLGKNMVGNYPTRYYPVMLSAGDIITISLTDSAAPTNNQSIFFYDKDFNQIEYWALRLNELSRTVTIVHDGICYVKIAAWFSGKKFQMEKGGVATTYEEYKDYVSALEPLINVNTHEDYLYKLRDFKKTASQYRKGNTSGSWYDRFVLLHHSDNHVGSTFPKNNLKEVSTVANDVTVDAVVNTGDMTNGGGSSDTAAFVYGQFDDFTAMSTDVMKATIPYLATLGNHDANDPNDTGDRELEATTKEGQWTHVYAPIAEKYSGIVWGDSTHYKHYHYYDITKGSYKLRIIVLDSLDHPDYASGDSLYQCQYWEVYSQEQIDWLCDTALNVPSGDYGIIIVNHFPFAPFRNAGYSEEWPALNDGYFAQGWKMIPEIVQAWTNRTTLSKTYTDVKLNQQNITVDADFSNIPSGALFVCYMCGHTHSKNAFTVKEENGEDFGQLMLCEDSTGQQGSALNRAYKYDNGIQNTAASQVTIDIAQRKVYRTAYGVYQHCSEEPMPETMIFTF